MRVDRPLLNKNIPICLPFNITNLSTALDPSNNLNNVINDHIDNYRDLRFLFNPNDPVRYSFFNLKNSELSNKTTEYKQKLLRDLIKTGTVQLNFNCDYFNNTITEEKVVGKTIANDKHISGIDNLYNNIENEIAIFVKRIYADNECVNNSYIFDVAFKDIVKNRGVQLPPLISTENTPDSLEYIIAPFPIRFRNKVYLGLNPKVTFKITDPKDVVRTLTVPIFDKDRIYAYVCDITVQYLITQNFGYNNLFTKKNRNKYTQDDDQGFAKLSIGEDDQIGQFRNDDMLNTDEILIITTLGSGDRPLFEFDPLNPFSQLFPKIQTQINTACIDSLITKFDNPIILKKFLVDHTDKMLINDLSAPMTPREIEGCLINKICISDINYANLKYYIYNPVLKSSIDDKTFESLKFDATGIIRDK